MVLLRRVIGDALRSRRQGQHRTLREVSTAANVSLGYLSEIERGQKEPSSELLAAICEALGAQLSEVLREVSDTVALAEQMEGVLMPVGDGSGPAAAPARQPTAHRAGAHRADARPARPETRVDGSLPTESRPGEPVRQVATEGTVSVSIHRQTPLKATLRATRNRRPGDRGRDVVCAA